jgi:hypothetical protein
MTVKLQKVSKTWFVDDVYGVFKRGWYKSNHTLLPSKVSVKKKSNHIFRIAKILKRNQRGLSNQKFYLPVILIGRHIRCAPIIL